MTTEADIDTLTLSLVSLDPLRWARAGCKSSVYNKEENDPVLMGAMDPLCDGINE